MLMVYVGINVVRFVEIKYIICIMVVYFFYLYIIIIRIIRILKKVVYCWC